MPELHRTIVAPVVTEKSSAAYAARNLLFVRGAVPGPMNGLLTVRKQGGASRHD